MPASSVRSTPGTCCRAPQLWAAPGRSPQQAAVPLALRQEGWGLAPRGAVVFLGGFVPCRKAGVHLHTSGLAAPSPSCPVRSHTCWPCLQTLPCPPAWSWQADPPRVSTTKWPLKRSSCPVNPPRAPSPCCRQRVTGVVTVPAGWAHQGGCQNLLGTHPPGPWVPLLPSSAPTLPHPRARGARRGLGGRHGGQGNGAARG